MRGKLNDRAFVVACMYALIQACALGITSKYEVCMKDSDIHACVYICSHHTDNVRGRARDNRAVASLARSIARLAIPQRASLHAIIARAISNI